MNRKEQTTIISNHCF